MPETQRAVRQFLSSLHRAGVSHVASPVVDEQFNAKLQAAIAEADAPNEQLLDQEVSSTGTPEVVESEPPNEPVAETTAEPQSTQSSRIQEPSTTFSGNRVDSLSILQNEVVSCTNCPELATTRTQTVFGVGDPNARLLFLGEAPGADEDRQGEPFVGAAGQKLTEIIEKGMKLSRDDVYIMNVLKCRPPGNRNPTVEEADSCRGFLDRQLQIIQPEFICCLGGVAATNLLRSKLTIGRLRGKFHDYNGIKVLATYHPAYLLRNPSARKQVWEDIQMLMAEMELR